MFRRIELTEQEGYKISFTIEHIVLFHMSCESSEEGETTTLPNGKKATRRSRVVTIGGSDYLVQERYSDIKMMIGE